jgi:hypothetical protein
LSDGTAPVDFEEASEAVAAADNRFYLGSSER